MASQTFEHLIGICRKPEGVYRVHIYPQRVGMPVNLESHASVLGNSIPFSGDLIDEIGDRSEESEGEFTQGVPRFNAQKLSLRADPVFAPLIKWLRNPALDIWCEISLAQHGDFPARPADASRALWPKKSRSFFFGRLERSSFSGHVGAQRFDSEPDGDRSLIRHTNDHLGTLTMEFVHWLKVRGEADVKDFLDWFVADTVANHPLAPDGFRYRSWYDLINELCRWVVPTGIFKTYEIMDWRLDPTLGELQAPMWIAETVGAWRLRLNDAYMRVTEGTAPLAFFVYDANGSSENSFYRFKDQAEALVSFSQEWKLFPQFEIPTMEEVVLNGEIASFLFLSLDRAPIDLFIDHDEDTIDYTPAAAYASEYKVDSPNADGIYPTPAFSVVKAAWSDGSPQSYKTLTRFVGSSYNQFGALAADIRGWELFVLNGSTYATAHVGLDPVSGISYTSWSGLHAAMSMRRWGAARSIIQIKGKGIGVEPFGHTVSLLGKNAPVRKTLGFWDFSAFPLYRKFTATIGLMADDLDPDPALEYLLISLKRTPGGGSEYKLIEIGAAINLDGADDALPPDPPVVDPPDTGPPTIQFNNPTGPTTPIVSGPTYNVKVQATDDKAVTQVSLLVDSVFIGTLLTPTLGGLANEYWFTWDTTTHANGTAKLKAYAYDAAGNSAVTTFVVNVLN